MEMILRNIVILPIYEYNITKKYYVEGFMEYVKLGNIINNLVGHFKKRDYFEVAESEKAKIEKAPEVKF